MELRPFNKFDFKIYAEWFSNPKLNTALGPMDEEWRDAVVNEQPPTHFAVIESEDLVAVIGVCFPTNEEPTCVITELAVNPDRLGEGIGAKTVELVVERFELKSHEAWVAFVDTKNTTAQNFFRAVGWIADKDPDQHGMIRFVRNRVA